MPFAASLSLAAALALSPVRPLQVPGELLVRTTHETRAQEVVRALAGDPDADRVALRRSGWLQVPTATTIEDALTAASTLDAVAEAEPNYYVWSTATVDHAAGTWLPDDPELERQWNLAGMGTAWYRTRGDAAVVVAVLDSGLRIDASGEQPASILPGWDFVDGDADPDDGNGHGTHIASVIAQATDNGQRAAGLCPETSILPVRVLDDAGRGTSLSVAEGIYWATDVGADVINLSLAMSPLVRRSEVLRDAVRYAAAHDVILVAASGNDGAGVVSLPAALNDVIAVGSVNSAAEVPDYSNGGDALDLTAPGGDDTDRDGDGDPDGIAAWAHDGDAPGLYLGAGTSQAAAHVSAAAALLISLGENGRDRIRSLLTLTAVDVGDPGWDPESGHGRLDAATSVAERAAVNTVRQNRLEGWVPGGDARNQQGVRAHDVIGALVLHDAELLVVLGDGDVVLGFVDLGGDRVGWFELDHPNVMSALNSHGGLLRRIDAAGGLLGLVDGAGGFTGAVDAVGGLLGMLGSAGGFTGAVDGAGGLVALVESSGGMVALLDVSGGFTGAVDAVGGLLGMLASSGGLMSLLEPAGGILGMLGSSGGLLGLVGPSGGILGLVDGAGGLLATGLVRVTYGTSARHR